MSKQATVRYVGRNRDGVTVRVETGWSEPIEHGETFTTTTEHAESLLTQAGEWERVPTPRANTKKEEDSNG